MYAQFQSYQHAGAAASTQQPSLVWNGSSWVQALSAPAPTQPPYVSASSGVPPYQQPIQVQAPAPSPDAVVVYTRYYHEWTKRAGEQLQVVERCTNPTERAQAQGHYDWYKYYADQASRAANWFYSNPGAPAPFDLPPAPPPPPPPQHPSVSHGNLSSPPWGTTSASASSQYPQAPTVQFPQQQDQWSGNQPAPSSTSNSNQSSSSSQSQTPDTLKRYVDRCLSLCNTPDEKQKVMSKIEEKISAAIMNGSLHSKDWNMEPTVSSKPASAVLPEIAGLTTSESSKYGVPTGNAEGQFYGPSSANKPLVGRDGKSSGSNRLTFGQLKVKANPSGVASGGATEVRSDSHSARSSSGASDSYYGPQSSSPRPTHSSSQKSQQSSSPGHGYYGPMSTPTDDFIALPTSGEKRKADRKPSGFNQSAASLNHRAKRFADHAVRKKKANSEIDFDRYMGKGTIGGSNVELDEVDYENMKVKGTCLTLEKDYLRLTAPPRAELVRPQHVLELHLCNLKAERQRQPSERRDYLWFCSQLKAVRQDCTVQHIQNSFAVDVYETHARIALEEGDLNEYNQCQTQLKELYRLLEAVEPGAVANRNEFIAYRLLYYVFLTGNHKYDGGSSDLFKIMNALTSNEQRDPAIQHALQVRVAVADVDYHKFFHLYQSSPNLGSHLMDLIVPGMRFKAVLRFWKAYRPSVEVTFVLSELGFETPADDDRGVAWLESCGCVLSDEKATWRTKDTLVRESDLVDKKSLI